MRATAVLGTLWVGVVLCPVVGGAQHIPTPQGSFDVIEVVKFFVEATVYYPAVNEIHTGVSVTGGAIDAQNAKVYLGIRNKSGSTLSNVEWRIYKGSGGPGQLDSGVQTIASISSSQTGWTQVNVPWQAIEGSYQLVGVVDPNRKIGESESMRANNVRTIALTVGPRMMAQPIDPAQAGAPQNVSLNVDAGLCQGNVSVTTSGLRLSLSAPYPLPIPFPGCTMRPEFYKGSQLRNGWSILHLDFPDAIGNYPPPPASTYSWITQPSGTALQGQVSLSIPSRSSPCSSSAPCLIAVSRYVKITIRGPAEKSPYPSPRGPLGGPLRK